MGGRKRLWAREARCRPVMEGGGGAGGGFRPVSNEISLQRFGNFSPLLDAVLDHRIFFFF